MRLATGSIRTTLRTGLRRLVPVTIIGVGLAGLIGCFTIPATKSFQVNGNRLPETLIGTTSTNPIILGQTRIDDALIALAPHTRFANYTRYLSPPMSSGKPAPSLFWTGLAVSKTGRSIAVPYLLRTGTEVWPLCFQAGPRSQARRLILTFDEAGIVQGFDSRDANQPDGRFDATPYASPAGRFLDVLSDDARAKLRAAGILADDATLREVEQRTAHNRAYPTNPAAATTQSR